jgi:hypothetical protein
MLQLIMYRPTAAAMLKMLCVMCTALFDQAAQATAQMNFFEVVAL